MIHSLIIDSEMEVSAAKKLARKLAMTGGYEVQLGAQLDEKGLTELARKWRPELMSYTVGSSAYRSSLSARLLKLVIAHPNASESLIKELRPLIEA